MTDPLAVLRRYRHPVTPLDYNFGFFLIFLTALTLTTPLTPGWRLFRCAIAGPAIALGWLWLAWVPYDNNDMDQWGVTVLMTAHAFRTLDHLVFFQAEEHLFRVHAVKSTRTNNAEGRDDVADDSTTPVLLPEPIPPPYTLAKFYWGMSLFWSWRGIGWNHCCPLPYSSRRHPFTRTSSRYDYLLHRLRNTVLLWIFWDIFRTFTNLAPRYSILLTNPYGQAPPYTQWSYLERAVCSIVVVARIVIGMEKSHLIASIACVGIGGWMGWEGEIWEPYGWPPLFGSFDEILKYPGLAVMWSRTWQGYFRRWLHVLGWIGIGENVLGLVHTGESAHPRTTANGFNGTLRPRATDASLSPSPAASGHVSPAHPLPSGTSDHVRPNLTAKMALSNFLKSIIVFTLSGLLHDCATYSLLLLNSAPDEIPRLRQAFVLTPFFLVQPFALVVESLVKTRYRQWKTRAYPRWRDKGHPYPANIKWCELVIGFTLTWVWLGWSAGWFVEGLTKSGKFSRDEGKPVFPSLVGGLIWGKWWH